MTLLQPGDEIAGCVVDRALSHGRVAEVYRVSGSGGRPEAMKVIMPEVARSAAGRVCFRRESELAEALDHPHIAIAYDHGEERWPGVRLPWATREFMPGGAATTLLRPPGVRPELRRVIDVLAQVASALDHVHGLDLVHRDVRPSNILLDDGDRPRAVITDFGLARFLDDALPLARHGRVAGSVAYAPPELLTGQRLGPQTDVYQLTCTAVELLTGRPPYPVPTRFEVVHAHLSAPPPSLHRWDPELPAQLDAVVAAGLAKHPADRPTRCADLVAALGSSLATVGV